LVASFKILSTLSQRTVFHREDTNLILKGFYNDDDEVKRWCNHFVLFRVSPEF